MKTPRKYAAKLAITSSIAVLFATSTFADSRPQDRSWRDRNGQATTGQSSRTDHRDGDRAATTEVQRGERVERSREVTRETVTQQSRDSRGTAAIESSRIDRSRTDRQFDRRDASPRVDRSVTAQSFDRSGRNFDRNGSYDRRDSRESGRSDSRDTARSDGRRAESRAIAHDFRNAGRGSIRTDSYRENARVSDIGVIRSFSRERDGYRVFFDRGLHSYWVPDSFLRGRGLRVGLSLRFGGIFRSGAVFVDVLGWPGDPYYNDPYYNDGYYNSGYYDGGGYGRELVRGTVDRVDYRTGTVWLVDDIHRALITVDMRSIDPRYSRLNVDDLRRGDRITLSGAWLRGGLFAADSITGISSY